VIAVRSGDAVPVLVVAMEVPPRWNPHDRSY
jgi:hypothetical protein